MDGLWSQSPQAVFACARMGCVGLQSDVAWLSPQQQQPYHATLTFSPAPHGIIISRCIFPLERRSLMPIRRLSWMGAALLLAALILAACGLDVGAVPTLTPDPALELTAAALLPTAVPTATQTPTPVAVGDESERVAALLSDMVFAVNSGRADLYLSYVDLADPVFATEHRNWVNDWLRHPLGRFDLSVRNLTFAGDEATATLHVSWTLAETQQTRGAEFLARFRRAEDGAWRYAGEAWITSAAEGFRVRVALGLEDVAEAVIAMLPEVRAHVTTTLDHVPGGIQEIKIYDNALALVATTALSLPEIAGWNEPGEALKLVSRDGQPPEPYTLAHEYTHFTVFDLGQNARDQIPWWLHEGVAELVASQFWTLTDRNARLLTVREWQDEGRLVAWDAISVFEETPQDLWRYVYPQGYAFARYVSETYGQGALNEWLRAMAGEMALPEATRAVFEMSFSELNDRFLVWLAEA